MLNEKQNIARLMPHDKPLLILAGAGSGKTSVISHRIVKLHRVDGIAPSKILGVTFTRKSANELAERVNKLDPKLNAGRGGVNIGTFHSIALGIMRRLFNTSNVVCPLKMDAWTIIDQADQKKIIKDCIKAFPARVGLFKSSKDQVAACLSYIGDMQDAMKRHEHINGNLSEYHAYCNEIYGMYEKRCRKESLLDFNNIILVCIEMLRDYTHLRNVVSSWFQHIIVDEFQDTSSSQEFLLKLILNGRGTISVVGDDDQSVYRFRGASPEFILKFPERNPGCEIVTLEQNYRSTKNILTAANRIIANNSERHPKTLFTDHEDGDPVDFDVFYNAWEEADFVAGRIEDNIADGTHPNEIAILCRSNAQTIPLEKSLSERGIAYRVTGGTNFWAREEITIAMAYVRLCINPADSTAFTKVSKYPKRGIGPAKLLAIEKKVTDQGMSFAEALVADKKPAIRELGEILNKLSQHVDDVPVWEFIDLVMTYADLIKHFREFPDKDRSESKVDNLHALREVSEKVSEHTTLAEFCEQAALTAEGNKKGNDSDAVQIVTCHSAKGLEWDNVYIVGMMQGMFPHGMSILENNLEEERRLAYVAFTRAKKKLCVTAPLQILDKDGPVSMFVEESGIRD
jgi:DNA helicase II / ATP-dependent DNA helicase PcrA